MCSQYDLPVYNPDAFYADMSKINVAIIGVGGVGTALISQLKSLPANIQPTIVFISRSNKQLYSSSYTPVDSSDLQSSTNNLLSLPELASYLSSAPNRAVVVDNTSNQSVAEAYTTFLSKGISVITPNKKAFSSSLSLWKSIFSSAEKAHAMVYHESSVGAGLPVISTLNDLIATGDKVTKIEGVFSGTMSFLFNEFAPSSDQGKGKWSEIVKMAKEKGYTEPDPRDDLNGMDVARKCTILARLVGLEVEGPESFEVQSLIPSQLSSAKDADDFMARLPEFDGEMEGYKEKAAKERKVVRYVGKVDVESKVVKVGLEMFEKSSPMAGLSGSNNLFVFSTKRYGPDGLVMMGAGAGNDVTAMGVMSDLLKVIERSR